MCKLMVIMGIMGKTNMGACTHHTGWGLRERERRQGEEKRRKEMEAKREERRGEAVTGGPCLSLCRAV